MKRLPGRTDPQGGTAPVQRDWFGLADFQLPSCLVSQTGGLYLLDDVGSTNDFLLGRGQPATGRLCRWDGWGWQAEGISPLDPVSDPRPGTVAVSRRQFKGRGRQGRSWQDCGGLHFSLVMPPVPPVLTRCLSVWLGLEVVLCLRESFNVDVRLKWPNDLLVRGRKLGGLLLETKGSGSPAMLVAGLGINLRARSWEFPAELQGRATSLLQETGRAGAPGQVAHAVLQRITAQLDQAADKELIPDWPALAYLDCLLGRQIILESGSERLAGRAAGIDAEGELMVETGEKEVVRCAAGDVHVQWGEDIPAENPQGDDGFRPDCRGLA